jgi:PKD repeat protein
MKRNFLIIVTIAFACCFSSYGQQIQQVANYLQNMPDKGNWSATDLADLRFTDVYTDEQTGITHAYVQQQHNGIPVYNGISAVAFKNNTIVHAAPVLIANLVSKVNAVKPELSPVDAIIAAFNHLNVAVNGLPDFERYDADKKVFYYQWSRFAKSAIAVQMVYQPLDNQLCLAYNVTIEMNNNIDWWNIRIDALKGVFLDKNNYTVQCNFNHLHHTDCNNSTVDNTHTTAAYPLPLLPPPPASYNVFQVPLEAPSFGVRTIVNNPHDSLASPYAWHDTNGVDGAEFTITRGNNVHAYEDANDDNLPGYAPDGGAGLNFNFSYDGSQPPLTYQDASITNLFYMNNICHDVTYKNGFTDAAGNFQSNNYGRGGLGNDYVRAEAFDGSGINNANFSTPPDGTSGRMQMYVWTGPTPDIEASMDNGIIAHEFGHGLSNRLTGGPSNTSCLSHSEQGGEGWSDWLALILTIEPGDSGAMGRGIGTYALGQPTTGLGIRRFRYSTDMSINPQTYADLASSSGSHQKGEIWCDAIWDMTWFLINDLGYNSITDSVNSGNNIAMRLVLEGMKLQPCNPGYIDARDAILLADQLLYNNAHRCTIWQAFARRGMGYYASQGAVTSSTDQVADFTMPYFCFPPVSAPVAGFTVNDTVIDCGTSVNFTDTSYLAYTWFWNFGDGGTSILQNPMHTYTTPGFYTVKLVVTNAMGADSVTKTSYIQVLSTFAITATATPPLVCQGNPMQLQATLAGNAATNYNVANISYQPDTTTGVNVSLGDDVLSSILPIGFTFNFYGNDYTDFYIGSNGYISFTPGQNVTSQVNGPILPSSAPPNNLIAAAWNDLLPTSTSINYSTTGVAPNRKLIVNYNARHYLSSFHVFKMQIQLHEGTNIIEIHTDSIPNTSALSSFATTTQGIENIDGSKAVTVPGRNGQHFDVDNDAQRFTPYLDVTAVWNPGSLNGLVQNINPNMSTIYSVTVNNGLGCTSTATVAANVDVVTPTLSNNGPYCVGDTVTLDPGSFSSYTWSDGSTSQTISLVSGGTYTVTVTNTNGCTGSTSTTISYSQPPLPVITGQLNFCAGSNATLDAGTYAQYMWSNGASTQVINPNISNTYTVTVIDANGCSASTSANVSQNNLPTPAISGQFTFCAGGNATLDAGVYMQYIWSTGETTQIISPNVAGNYTVTVTDGNGCTASASAVVTSNAALTPNITGILQVCARGNTVLTCNGIFNTYNWSDGSTTQSINVSAIGSYTVTVTDIAGCTGTASATVSNFAPIACNISGQAQYCLGGDVTWCASVANSYLWSNGSTTQCVLLNASGTYTVTVTSADGCTSSCSAVLSLAASPSVIISGVNEFCTSSPATLTATAGFVNYLWSNGNTNQSAIVTSGGTYTVTVTNNTGCTASVTKSITGVNAAPATPGAISGNTSVCVLGSANYQITAVPGASSYIWSVGAGATIASGQGTTAIAVNFANNAVSASVNVVATNVCGNSAVSTLAYTITSGVPTKPTVLNGPLFGRCQTSNVSYSCTVMPGLLSYVWTVPTGVSIVSGQGTPNIVVNFTPSFTSTGIISVYTTNGCSNSAAQVRSVSARPQSPVVSGPTSSCPSHIKTFTVAPVAGATSYTWTVVPGCIIQSGQGTTTLVVKWGNVGGQMYCAANNACGASMKAVKPVSIVCKEGFGNYNFTDFDLYPNPTSGNVQLKLDALKDGVLTINVLDLVGKICLTEDVVMLTGDNTFVLDVATLAKGIYQVNVMQDGLMRTKKLVVQ